MKTITTKCVILGHKNFLESDKLIFLYSDELGKIKAIAKGARKINSKFMGHLETLNFCAATLYFGPKNIIIQEISTDFTPFKSRKNLSTLSNALKIAEITNKMLYEGQSIENLTSLLKTTIKYLSESRKKTLISGAYTIKFLDKSGLIPDFKKNPLLNFIKTKPLKEIENTGFTKEEKAYLSKYIRIRLSQLSKSP